MEFLECRILSPVYIFVNHIIVSVGIAFTGKANRLIDRIFAQGIVVKIHAPSLRRRHLEGNAFIVRQIPCSIGILRIRLLVVQFLISALLEQGIILIFSVVGNVIHGKHHPGCDIRQIKFSAFLPGCCIRPFLQLNIAAQTAGNRAHSFHTGKA